MFRHLLPHGSDVLPSDPCFFKTASFLSAQANLARLSKIFFTRFHILYSGCCWLALPDLGKSLQYPFPFFVRKTRPTLPRYKFVWREQTFNYFWKKCSPKLTPTSSKVWIHQWLQLSQAFLEDSVRIKCPYLYFQHIIWIFSRKATIWILGSSKVVINSCRKCCKSKCTHDSCFSTSCGQKWKLSL